MLDIPNYERNANQKYNENITPYRSERPSSESSQITDTGEGVEKRTLLYCWEQWWSQCGKTYGFFLENLGFPHSSVDKESACNAGDPGLIPGSGTSAGEGTGYPFWYSWASLVASAGKESTCKAGDLGSIPGLRRSSREWKGYPLLYSDLENSMSVGPQSQTRLSNFHFTKDRATILSSNPTPEYIPGQNLIQKDT